MHNQGLVGSAGSSMKVLVLEDQFIGPCPRPQTFSSVSWTTKSSKTVKDSVFCMESVMYDHVTSINSVTATVHEVMAKNGLLTEYQRQLQSYISASH